MRFCSLATPGAVRRALVHFLLVLGVQPPVATNGTGTRKAEGKLLAAPSRRLGSGYSPSRANGPDWFAVSRSLGSSCASPLGVVGSRVLSPTTNQAPLPSGLPPSSPSPPAVRSRLLSLPSPLGGAPPLPLRPVLAPPRSFRRFLLGGCPFQSFPLRPRALAFSPLFFLSVFVCSPPTSAFPGYAHDRVAPLTDFVILHMYRMA